MWLGAQCKGGGMRRLLRWAFLGLTALSLAGFLAGVASWALASHDRTRATLAAASAPIQKDDTLAVAIEDLVGPGAVTTFNVRMDARGEASLPYLRRRVKLAGLSKSEAEQVIRDKYDMTYSSSPVTVLRFAPPVVRPNWPLLIATGAMPAAVFAAAPIVLWRRCRQLSRVRQGRCRACGYDLRATPDRCPECGAVPKAKGAK